MLPAAHRRHDISDAVWKKLEPLLPGREGAWGGRAHDNRRFIDAVFGSCALAHRGVIYHPTSEAGATLIGVSFVGGIAAYGNDCLKL